MKKIGCKIAVLLQLFPHGVKRIEELRFMRAYSCWGWVRFLPRGEQRALPLLYISGNSPLESLMRSHLYVLSRIRPTNHRPDFIHHRKISVLVLVELDRNKPERQRTRINK